MIVCVQGCANIKQDNSLKISNLDQLEQLDSIITASAFTNVNEYYSDKVCIYRIRYYSDDCEVVGYIAAPLDYLEKEYPILIYNRGGNRSFGALMPEDVAFVAHEIDTELSVEVGLADKLSTYANENTKSGFIVLASQYRGVDGGTGKEQFGGEDINDVTKLIDISESFSFAKQGGVYMAGLSRGGTMTYIASRNDSRIKAASVGSAISNEFDSYSERDHDMKRVYNELIGGTPEELPEEYEKRSAIFWANEIDVPLLIVHGGEQDWRVLTHHATDMADKLEEYGKDYRLIIYDNADHNLGIDFWFDTDKWFAEHPIN